MSAVRAARWAPVAIAVGIGAASLAGGGPSVTWSAANALHAAAGTLLVYCPVVGGICAGLGVATIRSGSGLLIKILPAGGVRRWLLREVTGSVLAALAGFALVVGAAMVVAGSHGSWPALAAWGPVVVGSGFVAVSCWAGWAVGLVVPSWFVPPLVALASYLLPAFDVGGLRAVVAFAANTSAENALFAIRPMAFAVYAVLIGAALGTSLALAAWRLGGGGLRAAAPAAVAFCLAAVSCHWFANQDYGAIWQGVPRSSWVCAAVGDAGSRVCLPPEQQRLLQSQAEALARFDSKILSVAPAADGWIYEPRIGFGNERVEGVIAIGMPVGPLAEEPEIMAETLAGSLARCPETDLTADLAVDQEEVLARAAAVLALWLEPAASDTYFGLAGELPDHVPDQGEARSALAAAKAACGQ
jgi:hypothetical protein